MLAHRLRWPSVGSTPAVRWNRLFELLNGKSTPIQRRLTGLHGLALAWYLLTCRTCHCAG